MLAAMMLTATPAIAGQKSAHCAAAMTARTAAGTPARRAAMRISLKIATLVAAPASLGRGRKPRRLPQKAQPEASTR